jgi:hypothetical protein
VAFKAVRTGKERGMKYDDWFPDPEPLNEDDPETQEDLFEMHKALGYKPEDLTNATPEYRAKYAEWLARAAATFLQRSARGSP